MSNTSSYEEIMSKKNEIMKKAVGIHYDQYEKDGIIFDYEKLMNDTGYSLEELMDIQHTYHVGRTPLFELHNLTKLARLYAKDGCGARIFLKDEASNPSGSYKVRRACTSVHQAKKMGYKGVIAATSGNYGAAVASQAAMAGLKCIIVQECYDSHEKGQPEIIEKARKCEAYGAEVIQLTVGPELFYVFLQLLEETGYFNASLYTPFGLAGVESLGYEIGAQLYEEEGKYPEAVVVTNAGGGNLTGTVRGLRKAGAIDTQIIGASVNLKGLHMASDNQFNKKSFTTGHTGFGIPFATNPDRSDVPRSAARPLRYMDRYVTVKQGEVFYMTEALAQIEGLERGPAGNISLAAAFSLAQRMKETDILVVQETEYTGAGKHVQPQLSFARDNGIDIIQGNPADEVPGENIILPDNPALIKVEDIDLKYLKKSYLKNIFKKIEHQGNTPLSLDELMYLCDELKLDHDELEGLIKSLG